MPFLVFPDPPIAPLVVNPGATVFTKISQLAGESEPPGLYSKMMFIRVAAFGAVSPPTLFLKAGTGGPVEAGRNTAALFRGPNPSDYVGDVQLFDETHLPPETHNVFQIQMGFNEDTAEQWQLGIKNNDAVAREFTWVVAESEPKTAQPWIDISPGKLSFEALVGDSSAQSIQVANKGTGVLNITSIAPPLPDGFALGSPLPLVIPPSRKASLPITFHVPDDPPPDGRISTTARLVASPPDTTATDSAGHQDRLSLTATTQRLEVVLLLDASGSMSLDPTGDEPDGPADSRWGELSSATGQFLNLLAHFAEGRGRFGITRFPARVEQNPATFDIAPMADIPGLSGMSTAQAAVAAVQPDGDTPMGDGLDHVLSTATGYFATDPLGVRANRRWLILMSDGAHNGGTHHPREFIAPPKGIAPAGASLEARNISVFAVAYGIENFTDVNHTLLKELCEGSLGGGQLRSVDQEGTTATDLAAALRDAIKSALTTTASPRDPNGVLPPGSAEVRHDVLLTQYDRRAALLMTWNTPDAGRLRLELLTPLQERLTPENVGQGAFQDVDFRGDSRSQVYLIGPGFLDGGADSTTRHGTWTYCITTPADVAPGPGDVPAGATGEHYAYDVLVDSGLQLSVALDRTWYDAGVPITVSARLTAEGKPLPRASVTLSVSAPTRSVDNWLTSLTIPAAAVELAEQELAGRDSSPLLIKKRAAKLAGFEFDAARQLITMPMSDPDGTGVYQATFTRTSVPGAYTLYATATGTSDGVDFRREAKRETHVMVRPEPEHSLMDIQQHASGMAEVIVTPRDAFGNVLLVDPQAVGGLQPTAPGTAFGDITTRLNGTYAFPAAYDPSHTPAIGLLYDGQEVVSPQSTLPLGDLQYPDRVFDFTPGALDHANRHLEAEAVLGPLHLKESDRFVSLGGGGRLVVGFVQHVVVGGSDADVTVFVRFDEEPCAYRLEAFSMARQDWVTLGESTGVTKSFSLRAGQLESTPALRITDTSGRIRDAERHLLQTPGVGIRAVGVRETAAGVPEGVDRLPDWLSRSWQGTN